MKKMRKGQTMVEYIIIICLIATTLIGLFMIIGKTIAKKGAHVVKQLDSEEGDKAEALVQSIDDPDDVVSLKDMD